MPYEVTIRCAVGKGDPLTKTRCHTDRQSRQPEPSAIRDTSREAIRAAEGDARGLDWVYRHRFGGCAIWICPGCVKAYDDRRA